VKVAYLCHRVPYPPDKGDKIRAFHQIRAIAEKHEVDLFTLADDPADLAGRQALLRYCRNVTVARVHAKLAKVTALPYLATSVPLTLPFFGSRALARAFRQALQERRYDRVFVYCSAMGQYVSGVQVPVICDFVDADSDKWAQYANRASFPMNVVYSREARCLRAYERRLALRSAASIMTTEREAVLLRQIAEGAAVHVIPNGVDGEFFRPSPRDADAPPAAVFTGDMSYYPNEDAVVFFANDVLPLIRALVPDTRFYIVGRNPGPRVLELARHPGVEVTGLVPDVRPWLDKAQVSVAPFSIAAGIQNKILEAMACGMPVVATPRTVQGLSREIAPLVETAADAPALARAVSMFLTNPARASQRGAESRAAVLEAYNWRRSGEAIVRLLADAGVSHTTAAS
jgi:sugar transferase (PEP-CTERM/EpsH1 system associated)